jgi:hypothetical protein
MTRPQDCSRWQSCSAPVCPLDPDWQLRKHIEYEPTCGLLLELAKPGAEATLGPVLSGEVLARVTEVAPAIMAAHGHIRRACERASRSGSRLRQFQALKDSQAKATA